MSPVTRPKLTAPHLAELAAGTVLPAQCLQADLQGLPLSRLEAAAVARQALAQFDDAILHHLLRQVAVQALRRLAGAALLSIATVELGNSHDRPRPTLHDSGPLDRVDTGIAAGSCPAPGAALGRCDEPDAAIAVLMAIPVDEALHPLRACSKLAKPLRGHFGQYFRGRKSDSENGICDWSHCLRRKPVSYLQIPARLPAPAIRWVVERSFNWREKCRWLWKNCERKLRTSLQFVLLAFLAL